MRLGLGRGCADTGAALTTSDFSQEMLYRGDLEESWWSRGWGSASD